MKWPWVRLLVVGFLGIAVGRMLPAGHRDGPDSAGGGYTAPVRRSTKVTQRVENDRTSNLDHWRREAGGAKPSQVPGLVCRVMEIADPFERRAALMEVLKHADASNGAEIIEGFAKVTRETGRNNTEEWKTALVEVGRRGGVGILEQWKAKGHDGGDEELWSGIYGMALDDPKGALAWLEGAGNEDLAGKDRLLGAAIAGTTLTNPDEGIRLMAGLQADTREECLDHFTWNLIQNGGLDRAVDWMLKVRESSATTEPEYASAVENEVYDKIFGAARWTDGANEMAGFLTRINAAEPISPERMMRTVIRMPGTAGLDLIDHLAQTPAMASSAAVEQALQAATMESARKSPEAVQQWLDEHPSSPIAGQVRKLLDIPLGN